MNRLSSANLWVIFLVISGCGPAGRAGGSPGGATVGLGAGAPKPGGQAAANPNTSGPSGPPGLAYRGRFDTRDAHGASFAWPNSAVGARFTGHSLAVTLIETPFSPANPVDNYYDVYLDGHLITTLHPTLDQTRYPVADTLPNGVHTVWLSKRTEASMGVGQFGGFDLGTGTLLAPPAPLPRRIEFIGDSGLTGYGAGQTVTRATMCQFSPATENADFAFPKLVAATLGADFVNLAYSGKGITRNLSADDAVRTLPVIYDRALPNDLQSTWDFTSWTPDVVVLEAGGADLDGDTGQGVIADPNLFNATYAEFVGKIRSHYPAAVILCVVGAMGGAADLDTLEKAVSGAVQQINAGGDANVFFYRFPAYDENALGLGCDFHASQAGHVWTASQMVTAIRTHVAW